MNSGQLDVAIRLCGITTLLLLGWLLFLQHRRIGLPGLLFAPMALCLSGFLIGNTPDPSLRLDGALGSIARFASGCVVVSLWWFCLACFDRQFRPRAGVLAVGLGWIALVSTARIVAAPVPLLSYALVASGLGIVAHLVWRLCAERDGDLVQKRFDARAIVAVVLGGLLLIDLLADLLFGFAWRPLAFATAQNGAILIFSLWLAGRVLDAGPGVLTFVGPPSAAPQRSDPGEEVEVPLIYDALRQQLVTLMEVERIHLDPALTFAAFVQRMNAPERVVRKLVNQNLGFDQFRSFLNHYRVRHARKLLADPQRSTDKLITIALDSGFGSLPSFNRVFRAIEGRTPSEYRDAAVAGGTARHLGAEPEEAPCLTTFEERSAAF